MKIHQHKLICLLAAHRSNSQISAIFNIDVFKIDIYIVCIIKMSAVAVQIIFFIKKSNLILLVQSLFFQHHLSKAAFVKTTLWWVSNVHKKLIIALLMVLNNSLHQTKSTCYCQSLPETAEVRRKQCTKRHSCSKLMNTLCLRWYALCSIKCIKQSAE